MTIRNGNGGFACEPASAAEGAIPCPCCGGTLTPAMLKEILAAARKAENGEAAPAPAPRLAAGTMIIDPHTHMSSRTTDDYEAMAAAGIVAVIEPAFWLGQPRTQRRTAIIDYSRASSAGSASAPAQFGIRHYCTIGLNRKEANNEALAEPVMDVLPRFLVQGGRRRGRRDRLRRPDRRSRTSTYRAQLELAKEFEHARSGPHAAPRQEARHLAQHGRRDRAWASIPARCVIDHNNEETVEEVLDRGFWAAFTIYPRDQDGQRAHGRDRAALRLGPYLRRLALRLGQSRTRSRCRRRRA